jgi:N utilization substance protein A
MEVIVNEDQLSLAIGKRGQNVRLATKLVGWNIDIRSEEEIKREVSEQMGALIASGGSVPLSVIEGVTAPQADALAEHGIEDIDTLSKTSVDDLVEFLDLSLDEAEKILNAAIAVVSMRDKTLAAGTEEASKEPGDDAGAESIDAAAPEETAADVTTEAADESDPTAEGYDEAVESGQPFGAEPDILAQDSADPVAITEAEPTSEDKLVLQELGRDLRPDTIVPSPDLTSSGAAALEAFEKVAGDDQTADALADEFAMNQDNASEASADETEPSALAAEDAASGESTDEEKRDASSDDAAN